MPSSDPLRVIADRWFRVEKVDSTITLVDEPYVDEFLRANIWHVRGRDRDLVVDSGLGVASLQAELPELFGADPILVMTHAHLDHMGSAHEFTDRRAHLLEHTERPQPGSLFGVTLAEELGMAAGTLPELLITALPRPGYDLAKYVVQSAPVTVALVDGSLIELGDRTFTALHLPGHSPGSIVLFDEHDGTLFSGDVIYDETLLDEINGSNIDDYCRSMHRLRELGVRVVHPGHGPSFDGSRLRVLIENYLHSRSR